MLMAAMLMGLRVLLRVAVACVALASGALVGVAPALRRLLPRQHHRQPRLLLLLHHVQLMMLLLAPFRRPTLSPAVRVAGCAAPPSTFGVAWRFAMLFQS